MDKDIPVSCVRKRRTTRTYMQGHFKEFVGNGLKDTEILVHKILKSPCTSISIYLYVYLSFISNINFMWLIWKYINLYQIVHSQKKDCFRESSNSYDWTWLILKLIRPLCVHPRTEYGPLCMLFTAFIYIINYHTLLCLLLYHFHYRPLF